MLLMSKRRLTGWVLTGLRFGLALAVLVYLGRSAEISVDAFGGLVAHWPTTLVALGVLSADHAVAAGRLGVLLRARGIALSWPAALRLTWLGLFFNTWLPGSLGGDAVKLYYAAAGQPGRRTE